MELKAPDEGTPITGERLSLTSKPSDLSLKSSSSSNYDTINIPYDEIFYLDLGSQSNIYCNARLKYPNTTQERLLIGTLSGHISCLERCEYDDGQTDRDRQKFHNSHSMQAREIKFDYIPGDAELISMDCFYQHETLSKGRLAIGVTLILLKPDEDPDKAKFFFNIYTSLSLGGELDIDLIAGSCEKCIRLDYTPYQVTHVDLSLDGRYEPVFLVSGDDQRIHMYKMYAHADHNGFMEGECEKYFPEFKDLPSNVIFIDTQNCTGNQRVTSIGCENGEMRVAVIDNVNNEIIHIWNILFDGPITSMRLFTPSRGVEAYTTTSNFAVSKKRKFCASEEVILLATSAVEMSYVFSDVASTGFSKPFALSQSDVYDCVTCSSISDVDCDGNNEILIGTYGQVLLIYKWYNNSKSASENTSTLGWQLLWKRDFAKPLLAIDCLDVMGDGMKEIAVVSLTGIHILQQDVKKAVNVLMKKFISAPKEYEHIFPNLSKAVQEAIQDEKLTCCKQVNSKASIGDSTCSPPLPDRKVHTDQEFFFKPLQVAKDDDLNSEDYSPSDNEFYQIDEAKETELSDEEEIIYCPSPVKLDAQSGLDIRDGSEIRTESFSLSTRLEKSSEVVIVNHITDKL